MHRLPVNFVDLQFGHVGARQLVGVASALGLALALGACRTTSGAVSASRVSSDEVAAPAGVDDPSYVPEHLKFVYEPETTPASPAAAAIAAATDGAEGGTYAAAVTPGSYLVVFAYQGSALNAPRNSHSFATIFKVTGDETGRRVMTDSHTISWLPVDGTLTILDNVSEPGRNYTLAETLYLARANNRQLRHSGIWRIDDGLFDSLRAHKTSLDRGSLSNGIYYKINPNMNDRQRVLAWAYELSATSGSTNCIHAVSDAIREPGAPLLDTGNRRGFAASDMIFNSFAPWRREALSALPSDAVLRALERAERDGDVVLQQGGDGGDEPTPARLVSTFRFFGGHQPAQIPVAGMPFVKDVVIGKSGQCGPAGTFFAQVRVGPGGGAATVQDPTDPSVWHPNGGQGKQINLIDLTLRSQYQLDCTVTVSIR